MWNSSSLGCLITQFGMIPTTLDFREVPGVVPHFPSFCQSCWIYLDSHSSPRAWHSCDSITAISSLDSTSVSLPRAQHMQGVSELSPGPLPSPGSACPAAPFLLGCCSRPWHGCRHVHPRSGMLALRPQEPSLCPPRTMLLRTWSSYLLPW